jgi:hypothetical protein
MKSLIFVGNIEKLPNKGKKIAWQSPGKPDLFDKKWHFKLIQCRLIRVSIEVHSLM